MEHTAPTPPSQRKWTMFHTVAMLSGIAIQINWLAASSSIARYNRAMILVQIIVGAAIFMGILATLRAVLHWMLANSILDPQLKERYPRYDGWAYTPFLLTYLGALGLVFSWHIILIIVCLFIAANVLLVFLLRQETMAHALGSKEWLGFLFLLSGMAALMYQIIWQRILFTIYGVNIESVTIIVSIFMFGLGIGSIFGGFVSDKFSEKLPALFLTCEIVIGVFGMISIPLIKYVGVKTQHLSLLDVSMVTFALLCLPTMMMGATLPILVTHINKQYKHVGKSVGILYFFNTIGSAIACFLTVELFFVIMGLQMTTVFAACFNFGVGFLVYHYMTQRHIAAQEKRSPKPKKAKELEWEQAAKEAEREANVESDEESSKQHARKHKKERKGKKDKKERNKHKKEEGESTSSDHKKAHKKKRKKRR